MHDYEALKPRSGIAAEHFNLDWLMSALLMCCSSIGRCAILSGTCGQQGAIKVHCNHVEIASTFQPRRLCGYFHFTSTGCVLRMLCLRRPALFVVMHVPSSGRTASSSPSLCSSPACTVALFATACSVRDDRCCTSVPGVSYALSTALVQCARPCDSLLPRPLCVLLLRQRRPVPSRHVATDSPSHRAAHRGCCSRSACSCGWSQSRDRCASAGGDGHRCRSVGAALCRFGPSRLLCCCCSCCSCLLVTDLEEGVRYCCGCAQGVWSQGRRHVCRRRIWTVSQLSLEVSITIES